MAIKVAAETQSPKGSAESILEKLKALDAHRAELLEGAKQEALDKAESAVAELNSLGFHYRLVEGASTTREPRKVETHTSKRQISDAPCPICHFQTIPPHDARSHRSQGKNKVPFTIEQLMVKKLSKVE